MFVITLLHNVIGGTHTTLFVQNNRVMLVPCLVNEASQEYQCTSFFFCIPEDNFVHTEPQFQTANNNPLDFNVTLRTRCNFHVY